MQQVSNKSHCIPLLRHHSVPYLGEHGRHQTKKIIEDAISALEFNRVSKDKSLAVIFDTLDKYTSSHGLDGELITEVYSLCLAEIVEQFQSCEYNPTDKEFQISCQIVDLIMTKFYDKISIKSELLEQHFVYFAEMITGYNQTHIKRGDDIRARDQIHETFFRIMSFHIDASVRRDDFSSIAQHKNLSSILIQYQIFLLKKINIKDTQFAERFSKSFQLVFDGLIHFVNSFKDDIHYDRKLLSAIVDFISVLINRFQMYLPHDFQSKINDLVDSSLHADFKTNYCIVKNIHVAATFLKFIQEKEAFLLSKMEQSILSTSRLEHCRMPDFNDFLLVYRGLFEKCPAEFQIQTMERIFKHSGNIKAFYFLLDCVLERGIRFPPGFMDRYVLILKNFIAHVKPYILAHAIKPESIHFNVFFKIAIKIFHICKQIKNEDSFSINSLCHWIIDLSLVMLVTPGIHLDDRDLLLKTLTEFISSCRDDSIKITNLKIHEVRQFSLKYQPKSELFYHLTEVTSSILAFR